MKPTEWFNSPSGTLSWGNLERVTPLIWDLHVWRSWTLSRRPHPIGAPIFYRISINNLARCRTVLWNEIMKIKDTWEKCTNYSVVFHTSITMLVTRARANSSKNYTLLMCRIWKMGRNLFSLLDIRDNFKVAYLEKKIKQSKNLSGNYHCLAHWQCNKLSQSLILITRCKSGYLTKFVQKMPLSNY